MEGTWRDRLPLRCLFMARSPRYDVLGSLTALRKIVAPHPLHALARRKLPGDVVLKSAISFGNFLSHLGYTNGYAARRIIK